MRSTAEIIVAVKECEPCTDEELRMALMALSGIEYFSNSKLRKLAEAVAKGHPTVVQIELASAKAWQESRFAAERQDPLVWLGPPWTPGTPEYAERLASDKAILKAATGIEW